MEKSAMIVAGVLAFLCLGFACTAVETKQQSPSNRVKKFIGDRAMAVLAEADRVETFRLKNERAKDGAEGVGGYAVTGRGKEMGAEFAGRLTAVLFDENTYQFDSAKGCKFDPGVGYRVWKGKEAVEIIFCFSCDELVIFSPKGEDGSIRSAGEDFDPARGVLLRLAKEALQEDKDIQGLKEDN